MRSNSQGQGLSEVICEAVRRERAAQRITQEELAERLGISRATVSDIEGGKRRVAVDDLEPLCLALGVRFADLLVGTRGAEARRILLGD